jgi:Mlc titration factor MtfA (ptsG expression regulator)
MLGLFGARRRARLRAAPFPPEWAEILTRNVPLVARLSAEDRAELRGHVAVLVAEKHWEGAGGLVVTDEIKVTVAAQAALLLLRRGVDDPYPSLDTILLYPRGWRRTVRHEAEGVVTEGTAGHLGESWRRGLVILAWDAARHGAAEERDGQNVVLHEFAHQLDTESGSADGAPLLPARGMYAPWARVLGAAYAELTQHLQRGLPPDLDPYGATNPAEFFAVATEEFFERPQRLRDRQPALYGQLAAFYQQDPAEW